MILYLENVCKHFGGIVALDNVSICMERGEIIGLIGPNGAGKTTLFNCINGILPVDSGKIMFSGVDITCACSSERSKMGVGRTFQINRLAYELTVLENILLFFQGHPGESFLSLFFPSLSGAVEQRNEETARRLLSSANLLDKINAEVASLSYGQQKILSLVCCQAQAPGLLLLDEPFAGLSKSMMEHAMSIIRGMNESGTSFIIIDHNIASIEILCSRVLFLSSGSMVTEGAMEEIRSHPGVMDAYLFKTAPGVRHAAP